MYWCCEDKLRRDLPPILINGCIFMNKRRMISVAPNYVIWKHKLYFRMFAKYYFDWLVSPDTSLDTGGKCNSGNFTLSPSQHSPEVPFLNFNTLQNVHNLIFSITTLG